MCCGNKGNSWQRSETLHSNKNVIPRENKKIWEDVFFEYTGATALTVTGNVRGKKYHFLFMDDRQLIDYRDVWGMRLFLCWKRIMVDNKLISNRRYIGIVVKSPAWKLANPE